MHAFPYTRMPFPHYYACVISCDLEEQKGWGLHVKYYCMYLSIKNKCEKHFIKMLNDVGMTMLKSTGTRWMQYMQAKPVCSMKAKARDRHATIITCVTPPCTFLWGYACYDCCMPIPSLTLPSCCSLFLMPSSLVLPSYTASCSYSF